MLARFRQEAKALARRPHPAIRAIHFPGDGEGLVCYVRPFVDGESLAERLRRRGPSSADEALKIAEPILQALSHAHAQGLVHRDIKPDNVMVEAKSGRVLLLDFGIAKLFDPGGGTGGGGGGGGGGAKTATGFTVGTVQYMSPEQALGQPNLDGRSDLYAFGAMLYQMVTGTPPYDGNSSAEIVGKHLSDPVPVASDVNAKIPRWLSTVIVKCLGKKPEDRFQHADEVLAALDAGRMPGSERLVGAHTLERQVRRSGQVRRRSASRWRDRFRRSPGRGVGCSPTSVPKRTASATSRPSSRMRAHRISLSRSTPAPPRPCGAIASCRRVPSAPTSGTIASTRTPAWPPTTAPIRTSVPTPTGTGSRVGELQSTRLNSSHLVSSYAGLPS